MHDGSEIGSVNCAAPSKASILVGKVRAKGLLSPPATRPLASWAFFARREAAYLGWGKGAFGLLGLFGEAGSRIPAKQCLIITKLVSAGSRRYLGRGEGG